MDKREEIYINIQPYLCSFHGSIDHLFLFVCFKYLKMKRWKRNQFLISFDYSSLVDSLFYHQVSPTPSQFFWASSMNFTTQGEVNKTSL